MKPHLLVSLLLALAVCSSASYGADPKIDEAALAELRKGRTTFEEIVRRFGRPNFSSTSWDGTRTAAYAYGEGRSSAALALPALGAVLGGSAGDTVVLYFDGKGLLTDYKVNQAAARPADPPAQPAMRYVEPSRDGPAPSPAAKPAAAATARPVEATPLAPAPRSPRRRRRASPNREVTVCRPGCRRARRETAGIRGLGARLLRAADAARPTAPPARRRARRGRPALR